MWPGVYTIPWLLLHNFIPFPCRRSRSPKKERPIMKLFSDSPDPCFLRRNLMVALSFLDRLSYCCPLSVVQLRSLGASFFRSRCAHSIATFMFAWLPPFEKLLYLGYTAEHFFPCVHHINMQSLQKRPLCSSCLFHLAPE